ncbi:hypothetical protein GCM10009116_11900 [Brevundimonas basaltis]|uniref:Rap1a immunity protein domain-containing protein n=1 Tax=Brevundimonas basaltis TaxID=472166 RepID=A0A7W8HVD7_9CAUL|nr:hypothetical protein [Brevundimonas basaltis]MBB5290628.1 hypothetical protein [Brevundimonas basaltis]
MKRLASILMALGVLLAADAVTAQTQRTLDGFLAEANRIPLNATSALRPSAHRLKGEAERAFTAVGREIREARAAGRTPPACPPERIELNPRQMLDYLNAIPQSRRQRMTVTDGIRSWMASRYPCSS